jgi:hypothetical protein
VTEISPPATETFLAVKSATDPAALPFGPVTFFPVAIENSLP